MHSATCDRDSQLLPIILAPTGGIGSRDGVGVMSLHKLTAGDGYTYLTRQVAAHDATERGFGSLGDYYSQKGEAPGRWMGRGLAAVPDFPVGATVTEQQMRALFGQGRHPNADAIERAARLEGLSPRQVDATSRLGKPYLVLDGANMFRRRTAGAYRDYNAARGLPEDTPIPEDARAEIRTSIATAMFGETYGRPPADARELSGHLARISRQATTAVAGYDLTFSPVKSVSTLWAIAPLPIARIIEQAHADAVADTLAWLEDHAAYTRVGAGGVAQVNVHGLIAAAFTHCDSRAGDPDLHTHVAISNKVQALTGRWYALDGRLIYRYNVAASERYNTRLEALLTSRLGVTFVERPGADGKRPVREIAGGDDDLPAAWSTRRAAIDARRAELAVRFQADHGRPPTAKEAVTLAQQANLETRQAKHEPRSLAEQRAAWRTQAATVLGGDEHVDRYVADALRGGIRQPDRPPHTELTRAWVERTADEVIYGRSVDGVRVGGVAAQRATWRENHVRAEAERAARTARIRPDHIDRAVGWVVAAALDPARSILLDAPDPVAEPAPLRRVDGTSVFTVAGAARYTSADTLAAERAILAAASDTGGRRVDPHIVDAVLTEYAASGVALNPGQAQLVRELAGSGRRVQLALAPAGTGKTTAMRALAAAWTGTGGTVIGLAPSAAAAAVLAAEIDTPTETLAKIVWHLRGGPGTPPPIMDAIGPDSLVIVDEAGMAATADLAAVIRHVTARGGQVRLVGDDQQLAAIGAGGVLRDLARTHGAATLSQVMRFTDPVTGRPNHAEGAASLAIRRGDPAGIVYYLDHGRVHVGDATATADAAYSAWAADTAAGADAVMLAPTRALAAELNQRARTERLAAAGPPGRQVTLTDASRASEGDVIITRRNDRTLRVGGTDYVRNGDRWRIDAVTDDAGLHVTHLASGMRVALPADYAARHVQLGYATTVHAAQGITADTCHTVATGSETRQLLYVALTRGRHANHLYLAVTGDGDPHSIITRDALLPPTPGDVLTRILARDDSPVSATTARADANRPDLLLPGAAGRYRHAIDVAAEDVYGPDRLTALDATAEAAVPGLTDTDAWPGLRPHLAALALSGRDPAGLLAHALTGRDLNDARDVAAVLDWRLHPDRDTSGPLPWLPPIPAVLADDAQWGSYLVERAAAVTALADATAKAARALSPAAAPAWATPIIDADPDLAADLAVWRAAHGIDDTDRRPTGQPQTGATDARAQRSIDARVTHVTGTHTVGATYRRLARSIDTRLTTDPYWPTLAARISAAHRAGIDITTIVRQVAAERPLPDEQPAAALWWRIAGHLSPAALDADGNPASPELRPDWTPALADAVGVVAAQRVMADPAWPALVAAVSDAAHAGWTPAQSLAFAYDLLRGGQPDDQPLQPKEIATALAWRIGMLADQSVANTTLEDVIGDGAAAGPQVQTADGHTRERPRDPEDLPPDTEDSVEPGIQSAARSKRAAARSVTAERSRIDDILDPDASDYRQRDDAIAGDQFRTTATVARHRLVEVNAAAEAFYVRHYRDVWAARYLTDRLGTDPTGDPDIAVGYAPNTWTALTRHLHALDVTDTELLAAGLAIRTASGNLIDRFRDRIIFPIKSFDPDRPDAIETRGFIGRRNPTAADDGKAGPKYLNTPATDLFVKGDNLYGLAEHAGTLAAGSVPVIVEGPVDALAVTVSGAGRYIGVAPLGTAFTDAQADQLCPYLAHHDQLPPGLAAMFPAEPPRAPVIVATDNDTAGRKAAHRVYWQLVARREDPRHLAMPDGNDPAEFLHTHGLAALLAALEAAPALADTLITDHTATLDLTTIEGRYAALAQAADITAARPAVTWPSAASAIAARLQLPDTTVTRRILAATGDWTDDPRGQARDRLNGAAATRVPRPAASAEPSVHHWATTIADVTGMDVAADPHWAVLADHLASAASNGYDVLNRVSALLALGPLQAEHPLRDLDARLIADCPDRLPSYDHRAAAADPRLGGDAHRRPAPPRTPAPSRPGPPVLKGPSR